MILNKDYLKTRYLIEPTGFAGWMLRMEGSNSVMKKDKHKMLLLSFAEHHCEIGCELRICDENGLLEDVIEIGNSHVLSI